MEKFKIHEKNILKIVSFLSFYIILSLNSAVWAQVVTTFAGSGSDGSVDATGVAASFSYPHRVAVDVSGNVYVSDRGNNKVRKITPAGVVTTFAGSGAEGAVDGIATAASFYYMDGLAVDTMGNVYVVDGGNNKIRKITPAGVVTTFAGSGTMGSVDDTGVAASFNNPRGVAVDISGNVYVGDVGNNKIRKITPAGVVTTLAGSGTVGDVDATGAAASFSYPRGVAVDISGNVYVADENNYKIRKITPAGVVTTVAGDGSFGAVDGPGISASFAYPSGVAIDTSGNIYVTDRWNQKIRKITPAGVVSTLAGSGAAGATDGLGTAASFGDPDGLAIDGSGNIYVAEEVNRKIRKIIVCDNPTNYILQPLDTIICESLPLTLNASVTGDGPLVYQWQKNYIDIPGATSNVLNFPSILPADSGQYNLIVANKCGFTDTSSFAYLTVKGIPLITSFSSSANSIVCAGNNVTFNTSSISIGSAPSFNYRKNGISLGAPDASMYLLSNFQNANDGNYDVVVTNTCGADTSVIISLKDTIPTLNAGTDLTFCGLSKQITSVTRSYISKTKWKVIPGGGLSAVLKPDSTVLNPFVYFPSDTSQGTVLIEISSLDNNCVGYSDTILVTKATVGLPSVVFAQETFADPSSTAINIGVTTSGDTPIWQTTGTGVVSGSGPYFYTPSTQDLNDGFVEIVGNSSGTGACSAYFASDTTRISLTALSGLYTLSGSLSEFPMEVIVSKKLNDYWTTVFDKVVGNNTFSVANMTNGVYKIQGVPVGGGNKLAAYVGGTTNWILAEEIVISDGNVTGKNITLETLTVSPLLQSTYLNGNDKVTGKVELNLLETISNLRVNAATDVKPVQSATINIYTTDGSEKVASATADVNGFYSVPDLSANTVKIEVEYPGTVLYGTTLSNPSQQQSVTTDGDGDPTIKNIQLVKIDDASKAKLLAVTSVNYFPTSVLTGIFPNPARGKVYIRLSEEMKNQPHYKAIVFDATGQPVETSSYDGSAEILELNINGLENGVYHLYLSSGNKSMIEKLIVID